MPGSIKTMSWFERLTVPLDRDPLHLEWLPWPAIQNLLDAGQELLLLPIGATEQHGPHLPINTDTVIAESVCAYASARTGVGVLPAISYSVSIGHTEKWPGTISLFHETFIHTIREIAQWALATGWKRLLLINSHFGNDASLRVAVDRLRFDFINRLHVAARNTFHLTPEIWRYFTSDAADLHANQAETDLLLFLAPDAVGDIANADDPDRTAGCVFPHPVALTSTNGVTGFPSRATAARGESLFTEMGEALTALIERACTEKPPLAWERTSPVFA